MIKATVFAVGMLASSVALADPFADAPAAGVRASYTLGFGGSHSAPLSHSLALSSGVAAGRGINRLNVMELRWAGQGSELLVAGQPFTAAALNANGDGNKTWGWFTDAQALYLLAAAGAIGTAIVVTNYRDESGTSGTGSSN